MALLALIMGSADAAGWMGSGVFAAHMTGNTVLLGISLAAARWHEAEGRAAVIAASVVGFSIAALLMRGGQHPRRRHLGGLFAALVALAAALHGHTVAAIALLAASLALANALYRADAGAAATNTAFLTGDLQSLAAAAFGPKRDARRVGLIAAIWLSYVAGAAATVPIAARPGDTLLPAAIGLLAFAALGVGRAQRRTRERMRDQQASRSPGQ